MDVFAKLCAQLPTCGNMPGLLHVDKTLTAQSTLFIMAVILFHALSILYLRNKYPNILKRFFVMGTGMMLFQFFTAPMWDMLHLGRYGYVYMDVSWVITMLWSTVFLLIIHVGDIFMKKKKELDRFIFYAVASLAVGIPIELLFSDFNIRVFAPEILSTAFAFIGPIPAEILFYIPVFSIIVISFYKFWMLILSDELLVPSHHKITVRNALTAAFWIFCLEILISPLVITHGLPSWKYIYRDINLLRIVVWILAITLTTTVVDYFTVAFGNISKYILYVLFGSVLFFQIEGIAIGSGLRWFTASVVNNFSGFKTPISGLPIEVAFALPIYMALAIAAIRYSRIVWDNKL